MSIFVFCEISHAGDTRGVAHELIGEAARLNRIHNIGDVTAVMVGNHPDDVAAQLCASGADGVIIADSVPRPDQYDELFCAHALAELCARHSPDILLFGATSFGRSAAPRLAAQLRTGLTADCTSLDIDPATKLLLQTRPAFGGNLFATITCPDRRPQMATVRPKVFPIPAPDPDRTILITRETISAYSSGVKVIERAALDAGVDIGGYDVIVSVGQGIGGPANIALAERLAERFGGALAASRPMVDSGLIPYARQVGQTGKTVSPKLYIALGISGAIQHMAGVGADKIIAVNIDPYAPIFDRADYGLAMDCGAFLEEILR